MERYDQIIEMEGILDAHQTLLDKLENMLEAYEAHLPEYQKLLAYYDSPQYLADCDFSDTEAFSPDVKCGVLSQDAVFNLISDHLRLAQRMKKLAEEAIKEG